MTTPITPADYHASGVITHAEKQALELVYRDNLSPRKAGEALGVSREAIRGRIRNAMRKIRATQTA